MLAGVVLAAGASTRLGTPKALVSVEGEPAVARLVGILREAGCDRVLVVLGADQDRIRPAVPNVAKPVLNPDWARGQTSSVQVGIQGLMASTNVVLWPVDRPAAGVETVRALVKATGHVRLPVQGGRRGHPIFLDAALRPEILALPPGQPLHDVVHRDPARVTEVPVEDAGIHLNVDTTADLEALKRHFGGVPRARPVA